MFERKNKKNLILKSLLLLSVCLGLVGSLSYASSVLAQTSCPANTTVSGTTVVFVGELTDLGGDATTAVWFEYGQTTAYGQKTSEKTLTKAEFYCITVSGLLPSTTYNYRAAAKNSADTSYGENRTFTTTSGPSVDLKANGSNGPITVAYNGSVNLNWVSTGVDSCSASGNWSSVKATNGSQVIENLTSSKVFSITCTGPAGSVSDSVTVNAGSQDFTDFSVSKTVRNLSRGTGFFKALYATPGETLVFSIAVNAGKDDLYDVIIKDALPDKLIYQGDLRIDNVPTSGSLVEGLNIGNLAAGQKKTVTFKAQVAGAEGFAFGQTELTNSASVSAGQASVSDTAKVVVTKAAVAGLATKVPTGLTNNIFFDSLILPLSLSLSLLWLFKSRIIRFEEWLDVRKKEYQVYKSKKILQLQVAKIKAKEFFGNIS